MHFKDAVSINRQRNFPMVTRGMGDSQEREIV